MPNHPSDFAVQRNAETLILTGLSKKLGFPIHGEAIRFEDCRVEVDGINREYKFLCEIYAHVGQAKGSQPKKFPKICSN